MIYKFLYLFVKFLKQKVNIFNRYLTKKQMALYIKYRKKCKHKITESFDFFGKDAYKCKSCGMVTKIGNSDKM
jgi:hypothetical protein